jgi:hypothetical protein
MNNINFIDAIISLNPKAQMRTIGSDLDTCTIIWTDGTPEISKADIQTEMDRLQAEYDAQEYARKRKAEYPSVQDLVVALYDTDDKTAIDEKRAEIKLKYPKPGA